MNVDLFNFEMTMKNNLDRIFYNTFLVSIYGLNCNLLNEWMYKDPVMIENTHKTARPQSGARLTTWLLYSISVSRGENRYSTALMAGEIVMEREE